jgi:hypothetical protein
VPQRPTLAKPASAAKLAIYLAYVVGYGLADLALGTSVVPGKLTFVLLFAGYGPNGAGVSFTDVATWLGGVAALLYLLDLVGALGWLRRRLRLPRPSAFIGARILDACAVAAALALIFVPGFWSKVALTVLVAVTFLARSSIDLFEWRRTRPQGRTTQPRTRATPRDAHQESPPDRSDQVPERPPSAPAPPRTEAGLRNLNNVIGGFLAEVHELEALLLQRRGRPTPGSLVGRIQDFNRRVKEVIETVPASVLTTSEKLKLQTYGSPRGAIGLILAERPSAEVLAALLDNNREILSLILEKTNVRPVPPRSRLSGVTDTIEAQRTTSSSSPYVDQFSFETMGRRDRSIGTAGKPRALRFIQPVQETVREEDLPKELYFDGGTLVVKKFSDHGVTVDELNTALVRVTAEVFLAPPDRIQQTP